MAEVRPKMSWGVEEEAIMEILFGEEIKCLGSDGFEGSEEERRICMNILYEVNISNFGNALSKMGNSQSKDCSLNKQPGFGNTENLVHVNPHSLNDTLVNISGHFNGVLGSKRHRLEAMKTSSNTNAKRLKMSSSDPLQIKEFVATIIKNYSKLVNCCPLPKSKSSMAPSSVTSHPCSSMNAANQKDKLGSFYGLGDGHWKALPFEESDKIAGGSYFKPTNTSCKTQQSRNSSGNTGNIFMVDPEHEHPALGKKMLLFHPKKISKLDAIENNAKVLKYEVSDANCRKNDFSAGVCALQAIKNSFSARFDKRSDEALPPDPLNSEEVDEIEKAKMCGSQEAGEVKKSGLCKKRGRKKEHSVEVNEGSSQDEGEVRKTVVCKKRRKEQTT